MSKSNLKKSKEKNPRKQEISFLLLYTLPRNIFGYFLLFALIKYLTGDHAKLFLALTMAGAVFALISLLHTLAKHWLKMENIGAWISGICSVAMTLGFVCWAVAGLFNALTVSVFESWHLGQALPEAVKFIFGPAGLIAAIVFFLAAVDLGVKTPFPKSMETSEAFE